MKTIEAAQFREQCLTLLNGLDSEGLLVTENGKPIARILPHTPTDASDTPNDAGDTPNKEVDNSDLFGILRGKGEIRGDIMSAGVYWNPDEKH